MKILYDHQAFMQIYGGISRSYVELLKHFSKDVEPKIAIKYSQNIYIKEILPKIHYPLGKLRIPYKHRLVQKINYKYACNILQNFDYEIFHATFDDPYFIKYVRTPYIITVHDLIPEQEPQNWSPFWLKNRKNIFMHATHIVAVSETTKKELLKYYPEISEQKVSVIYHGYELSQIKNTKKNNFGKYILYIGNRNNEYKNFKNFIKATSLLLKKYDDLKIVCTGNKFTKQEKKYLKELGVYIKFISIRFNDKELYNLYQNALLFVFPSLKEGFGIPILEAWANKCPIALSNIEIFHEISDDAAIYFDPLDIEDIRNAIEKIIQNENLRINLIKKGYERVKKFNWFDSANKLENIYKMAINKNSSD